MKKLPEALGHELYPEEDVSQEINWCQFSEGFEVPFLKPRSSHHWLKDELGNLRKQKAVQESRYPFEPYLRIRWYEKKGNV